MLKFWNSSLLKKQTPNYSQKSSRRALQGRKASFESLESRELLAVSGADLCALAMQTNGSDAALTDTLNAASESAIVNAVDFTLAPDGAANVLTESIDSVTILGAPVTSSALTDVVELETQEDGGTIVVDTTADVVDPNDGVTSLREAVEAAPQGATILFAESLGEATITLSSEIEILNNKLTIDGDRRITLDGNGQNRIFHIGNQRYQGSVQISNLTFANGYADNGGAIQSYGDVALTIKNCAFVNNIAQHFGGAIDMLYQNLTISDSLFIGNSADYGGAIGTAPANLYAINSVFVGNLAKTRGGAFYCTSEVFGASVPSNSNFFNCTIAGNAAGTSCGGFYSSEGDHKFYNTVVAHNYAKYSANIGGRVTLTNSFTDGDAGFVVAPQFDSNGVLLNANLIDLHLRGDSVLVDAGVQDVITTERDIDGNMRVFGRSVDIGAYEYGTTYVVDTTNDAVDPDDGVTSLREAIEYAVDGYTYVTFAESLGKATIVLSSELFLNKSVTIDGDNRVALDGNGRNRIFYVSGGTEELPVKLQNLTFQNAKDYEGGAIYNKGVLTIDSSTFAGNYASGTGGAVHNQSGTLKIESSIFTENKTLGEGGAIVNIGGTASIVNSALYANEAATFGGAVYTSVYVDGNTSLYNCTIAGNKSRIGGGVANDYGPLNVCNTIVSQNFAEYADNVYGTISESSCNCIDADPRFIVAPVFDARGRLQNAPYLDLHLRGDSAAIEAGQNDLVSVERDLDGNARIMGNAVDIGAYEFALLFVDTAADVVDPNDGVTSLREAIELVSDGYTIRFAESLGQAAIVLNDELRVSKALTIDGGNRVVLDGNERHRIFYITAENERQQATLQNLTLINGRSDYGGAVFNQGLLAIENTTISGNSAAYRGGAVYNDRGFLSIESSVICGNTADRRGGAVYNDFGTALCVNSAFYGNTASIAGAIDVDYGALDCYNCTISGNSATIGGALNNAFGTVNIFNTIVSQNYAVQSANVSGELGEVIASLVDADPGFTAKPQFDENGVLVNADALNLRLSASYVAIDAGNNAYVLTLRDLDGKDRVFGGAVDIGAYETDARRLDSVSISGSLVTSKTLTASVSPNTGSVTYQWYCGDSPDGELTPIKGAVGKTFSIARAYAHKYITVKATGAGDWCGTVSATTSDAIAAKLYKPNVKAKATSESIVLSWKAIDNAEQYCVEFKTADEESYRKFYTNELSFVLDDLDPSTSYDVNVRAETSNRNYATSDRTMMTITTELGVKVKTAAVKATTASIVWNAVDATQYYSVMRRKADGGAFAEFAQVTEPKCVISGLEPTESYEYYVVAVGDGTVYDEIVSETQAFTTTAVKKLTKPVVSTSAADASATIKWKKVANAERYLVRYKAESSSSYVTLGYTTNTSVTIEGLNPSTKYSVQVKAIPNDPNYKNSDYTTVSLTTSASTDQVFAELASEENDSLFDELFDEFSELFF